MPPKRTKKLDLSIEQSFWPTDHRKLSNLVDYHSGLTIAQRRHHLLEFEGLGYTGLKLDKKLLSMLNDGRIQKTLSNMLKYSAKADEKGSSFVFQKEGVGSSAPRFLHTRKMMYLGYDFSAPIPNKHLLRRDVQSSLSVQSMKKAEEFILAVKDFMGSQLELFKKPTYLKPETVAVSIMENVTGQKGYPASEEKQAWHSDYGSQEIDCNTPNMKLPVVLLLALADHVKLGILPRSHKLVAIEKCKDGSECNRLCSAIEYTLKVVEIIVFHPLLIHYGCAYSANEQSLRVHFYFDNDQLVRVAGDGKLRTFFFKLPVQPVSGPPVVKKGQKRNATIGTVYNYAIKRQRTEKLEEKSTKNVSTRVCKRVSKRVPTKKIQKRR